MKEAFKGTPWPVLLLVASFLCPTELSVYVGPARLPPHRALLLVLLVPAVLALFGRRGVRLSGFDFAFLAFGIWTVVGYIYHHGQADGLQTGGALALDSFGSYLVARAYIRDEQTLTATAGTLVMAVAVAGLLALPETLSGQVLIHDTLRQLTGYVHPTGVEKRMGLMRAYGTFDHPIHLGTFCASSLALAAYTVRRMPAVVGRSILIAGAAMLSVSSAPILSIAVQAVFGGFERATRGIKARIPMAIGAVAVLFALLSAVATRSPFAIIATGFTLDPWTGFYRLMIWENGLENVWANPVMGLGLNDWARPQWMVSSTVDAFWLVIAMRGGIPAFGLLVLGIVLVILGVNARIATATPDGRSLTYGWTISLLALVLVGCTVHYWNVPFAYFFFFVGLGGCLADPLRQAVAAKAVDVEAAPAPRVRWVMPVPGGASGVPALVPPADWAGAPRWPVPVRAVPPARPAPRRRR